MSHHFQDRKTQGRTRSCRSCAAAIIWLRTFEGKKIPVDAATVNPNDQIFEYGRHVAHFATCPNAKQHRRHQ